MEQKDTTVNLNLAAKKGVSEESILIIDSLHKQRDKLLQIMEVSDPVKHIYLLKLYYKIYTEIEFKLSKLWKSDKKTHLIYSREYLLPHCSCAKIDNNENYGTSVVRSKQQDCIYHGWKE